MQKQKSIKKNMLMSIILTTANFLFPLITYSYVARVLTPVGTGKVAFVYSILSYFSYIAMLGIPTYGLRECAKVRNDRIKLSQTVQELLIINLCSTVVAYVALIVAVLVVPTLYDYKSLFLVMCCSIFLNTIGLEWVYQALEEYSYITIRSILFKLISVGLTFFLIRSNEDYLWYGFLTIFTTSASYICNFINIRRYISLKKISKYSFRKHIKPIMTLLSATIIVTVYANFDMTMLGFIGSESDVGLYNSALKIKGILLSLSTAITSVIIPRMAYVLKSGDSDDAKRLAEKSLRVSFIVALPVAVYCLLYADNVIRFICGNSYLEAVPTLRVLMICVLPLILTNLFGNQILIPNGGEKRYTQSLFVGLIINIILNSFMIPHFGAFGAALATLIAEMWNVIWLSGGEVKSYRKFLIKNVNCKIYGIGLLISSFSTILFATIIGTSHLFVTLLVTASVFFGMYYLTLILLKEPLVKSQLGKVIDKVKEKQ